MAEVTDVPTSDMRDERSFEPTPSAYDEAANGLGAYAFMSPVSALGPAGHLGPPEEIEKELDLIHAAVRIFHAKPADLVMRECSAYSARLTEMRALIYRREGGDRRLQRIRTQQIDYFLAEIDRQWKTASRLIEVNRQDIQLSGGQT